MAFGMVSMLAGFLFFAFIYFIYAFNLLLESAITAGLGWYCLFVAILCYPFAGSALKSGMPVLAFFWALWGVVWGAFWVENGLQKDLQNL